MQKEQNTSERGRAVSQFMTPNPVAARPESTLSEIIDTLFSADIRHLPIVDDGRVVGIVSDRDVRSIAGIYLNKPAQEAVSSSPCASDFCETNVISVTPEDDILDVIDLMLSHKIGSVPVIDPHDQRLVGIVTYTDVLRELRNAVA